MSLYLKKPTGLTKRDERRRKLEILNPDGVPIDVVWDYFEVGSSVFIPAINTTEAIVQIKRLAKYHHWEIRYTVRSEHGKWGLRVWRLL